MVSPLVTAEPRGGEHQHRAQPLSPCLDQMRGDLGDARRVARCHAGADDLVHRLHVVGQVRGQRVMRFCSDLIHDNPLRAAGRASTNAPWCPYLRDMKQLLRSTDPTVIAFARALLQGEDIDCFEMDVNMSVLEGSIGILPRRLMVRDEDYEPAKRAMEDNGIDTDG